MLKIGLTGGIGSGKSTVASVFEVLGIPVYYADTSAKRLMNEDLKVKKAIEEAFGEDSYSKGLLNRKFLARIVFTDPGKLRQLNAIVHPATLADASLWMDEQLSPYAIKEAALIFESGFDSSLDYIIGVSAPQSLRISRTINRDNIMQDEVLARMEMQMPEPKKMSLCHFVIMNDEDTPLIPQVLKLHEQLIKLTTS